MTNFDFLKSEEKFNDFSDVAILAEKSISMDPSTSVINCRRAMEFAIKWMYSVDDALEPPYQDNLYSLFSAEDFRDIIGSDIWKRLDLIRRLGNIAVHNHKKKITEDQAKLCLNNLFIFMDFIAYCYADNYQEIEFNEKLLEQDNLEININRDIPDINMDKLLSDNKPLKQKYTARRKEQQQTYVPKPIDLTEYETRKIYIDTMLDDVGWIEGENWLNEVVVTGMPTKSGKGKVDYVLYDDTHKPIAIVEAKKTCVDVVQGRNQAKLYADNIERECGRRPVIFLTNGFETRIIDGQYPERKVAAIYSKRDLEKLFNLRATKVSLETIDVNNDIAGRYYQKAAVRAVCDSFDKKNRRKALIVMATGAGKTRTVIALCDVLLNMGWIKNVLFLADRNALVTQAKRSFSNLLPDLSTANLCEDKQGYNAHCIFSTYQTMINCIDSVVDEDDNKLFTCGHFDLIICDEAHRSIYNKYKDIFAYFDAPLVGLTATPKEEIDKNTYSIFELENGVPTYGYELAQAVKDGYLVDYLSVESKLKYIEDGIVYDDLSEEEKEEYEKTFGREDGNVPEKIDSSALNTWVFNEDTIKQVLEIVMENGLKIEYGAKLGKTIIFAKNHKHAEKILEIFNKQYPHLVDFAMVIDNQTKFAQAAIDEFATGNKLPQIAISVDMLDTGIDVPEILNLVFFKKVMSKSKFWQMIGRGTRLCPGLIDGMDKKEFYIFDFCGNFEFFRLNPGKATANTKALQSALFELKFQIAYKLQDLKYQSVNLKAFRNRLVDEMVQKVSGLDRSSFMIKQHLKYIDKYANKNSYDLIRYEDIMNIRDEVAPYIVPDKDDADAMRFDALMYGMELAYLEDKKHNLARKDLINRVKGLSRIANIPEIQAKSDLLHQIAESDYIDNAGIEEFEHIRSELRYLMKYLKGGDKQIYLTDFTDDILSMQWRESELDNDELKNYKAKAESYIRNHQDNIVIGKLKTNKPLTKLEVESLEKILWSDVGTKAEYEMEFGSKPLGEFVREIVGLDMNAAKEAFSSFLDKTELDSRQIYFVNQIIEYVVHNGILKEKSVLQESPFTDRGSITELFKDMRVWNDLINVVDTINDNATIIA